MAALGSEELRRKYVLWRCALVCERLRSCWLIKISLLSLEVRALEALGMGGDYPRA